MHKASRAYDRGGGVTSGNKWNKDISKGGAVVLGSASKYRRVALKMNAGAAVACAAGIYVCRCGHGLGIATQCISGAQRGKEYTGRRVSGYGKAYIMVE